MNALTIPAHSCASTRSAIIVTVAAMAFMGGRVARGVEAVAWLPVCVCATDGASLAAARPCLFTRACLLVTAFVRPGWKFGRRPVCARDDLRTTCYLDLPVPER